MLLMLLLFLSFDTSVLVADSALALSELPLDLDSWISALFPDEEG